MSPDPIPLPVVSQSPTLTRGVEHRHIGVDSSGGGRAEAEVFWEKEEWAAVTGGHQRCG